MTYIFAVGLGWVMGMGHIQTVESVPLAVMFGMMWRDASPWILRSLIKWGRR